MDIHLKCFNMNEHWWYPFQETSISKSPSVFPNGDHPAMWKPLSHGQMTRIRGKNPKHQTTRVKWPWLRSPIILMIIWWSLQRWNGTNQQFSIPPPLEPILLRISQETGTPTIHFLPQLEMLKLDMEVPKNNRPTSSALLVCVIQQGHEIAGNSRFLWLVHFRRIQLLLLRCLLFFCLSTKQRIFELSTSGSPHRMPFVPRNNHE